MIKKIIKILNINKTTNKILWIKTQEKDKFIEDFMKEMDESYSSIWLWNCEQTLYNLSLNIPHPDNVNIDNLFKTVNEIDHTDELNKILIVDNLDYFLSNILIRQKLENYFYKKDDNNLSIIVLSSTEPQTETIDHLFTVIHYDLPNKEEYSQILNECSSLLEEEKKIKTTAEDKEKILDNSKGLTLNEALGIYLESISFKNKLNPDFIQQKRVKVLKKNNSLIFRDIKQEYLNMGGNEVFKTWLESIIYSFSEEAKQFGVKRPKGYIAFGVPGSGKTMSAYLTAYALNIPLIELNFSQIMGSLVGQSEKAIESALDTLNALAPCVLLLDEVEKTLGGYISSASSDSGTLSRVLGKLLTFMQDNENVFIVMTSNDVTKLPSELLRSGRIETQWYFGIPSSEDRKEILNLYLKQSGKKMTEELEKYILNNTAKYTGAEIKNIVENMIRNMWIRYIKENQKVEFFTKEDFIEAVKTVVPIYKSSNETILKLENYAKNRAVFASKTNKGKCRIIKGMDRDFLN